MQASSLMEVIGNAYTHGGQLKLLTAPTNNVACLHVQP